MTYACSDTDILGSRNMLIMDADHTIQALSLLRVPDLCRSYTYKMMAVMHNFVVYYLKQDAEEEEMLVVLPLCCCICPHVDMPLVSWS